MALAFCYRHRVNLRPSESAASIAPSSEIGDSRVIATTAGFAGTDAFNRSPNLGFQAMKRLRETSSFEATNPAEPMVLLTANDFQAAKAALSSALLRASKHVPETGNLEKTAAFEASNAAGASRHLQSWVDILPSYSFGSSKELGRSEQIDSSQPLYDSVKLLETLCIEKSALIEES
jgi:hypothetical protein